MLKQRAAQAQHLSISRSDHICILGIELELGCNGGSCGGTYFIVQLGPLIFGNVMSRVPMSLLTTAIPITIKLQVSSKENGMVVFQ